VGTNGQTRVTVGVSVRVCVCVCVTHAVYGSKESGEDGGTGMSIASSP